MAEESKVCSVCGLDHDLVRQRCRESLFVTASILCGFKDLTPRLHGYVAKWVEENIRSGRRRMMLVLPRGHLKSSIVTVAGSIWMVVNNPNVRILVVQASGTMAERFGELFDNIFHSAAFLHYFPEIVPDRPKRWNKSEMEVNRTGIFQEATITLAGINTKVVGGHYDVQLLDDLLEETTAESDSENERVIRWLKNADPLFVIPGRGVQIIVGTRWRKDDVIQYVKDNTGYEILEAGCRKDKRSQWVCDVALGEPIWSERFSEKELSDIKDLMGPWSFSCQYDNSPEDEGLRRFGAADFMYYRWKVPHEVVALEEEEVPVSSMVRTMTVDPSMGESKSADEAAIVVSGMDRKKRKVVLDIWSGRVTPIGLIEQMFRLQNLWKPQSGVGIEEVAFQKALQYFLRQEMTKRDIHFPVYGLKSGGKAKTVRIASLSPFFKNKEVYISMGHSDLRKQLLDFPDNKHDDIIDALAYHVPKWRGTVSEEEQNDVIPEERDEDETGASYYLKCST